MGNEFKINVEIQGSSSSEQGNRVCLGRAVLLDVLVHEDAFGVEGGDVVPEISPACQRTDAAAPSWARTSAEPFSSCRSIA